MSRRRTCPPIPSSARFRLYRGRKSLIGLVIALIIGAIIFADRAGLLGTKPTPDFEKYNDKTFKVVHVVDGDTLDVDCPDEGYSRTRVRLWGVDTPETVKENTPVQHFGPQASEFTKRSTLGKIVKLELELLHTRDKYGRLLAYVILPDGTMLNRILVAEGYGYADPRYEHKYERQFQRLQNQAIAEGRGLWRDANESDLPYYLEGKVKLKKASGK